jgi:AcrR family transcriptional regulator
MPKKTPGPGAALAGQPPLVQAPARVGSQVHEATANHAAALGQHVPKFRRRAEARPDEVLDAALDLFIEKGFAATRVEDIARRAGLSKGAVYLYFPSKEAILEALVRRAVVPIADTAVTAMENSRGTPREAFMMLFNMMSQRLGDPRVLAVPKLIIREVGAFPELAAMYRREVIDRGLSILVGIVRRGVESGVFRPVDPELAARSVIGAIGMHLLMAEIFDIVPDGGLNLPKLIETHIDILYYGLVSQEAQRQ